MGDVVEEILAEPEEHGYIQSVFILVNQFIRGYGWYILLGLGAFYYLWRNKFRTPTSNTPRTQQEIESWQKKEEQRLKAIQRLQQKYAEDAAIKAEKDKELEEKKKKARLAELEALTKKTSGQKLGDQPSSSKSLRPEYNPLMGDVGGGERVCYRRPGGGSGG